MLSRSSGLNISKEARFEEAQGNARVREPRSGCDIWSFSECPAEAALKPSIRLERAKAANEAHGIFPLKGPVHKPRQPFHVLCIRSADELSGCPVHSVEQVFTRPHDALAIAPCEGGGKKPRNRLVIGVFKGMGNPQRVVLNEPGLLKSVGGLVEPISPLFYLRSRGSATERGKCGRHEVEDGMFQR